MKKLLFVFITIIGLLVYNQWPSTEPIQSTFADTISEGNLVLINKDHQYHAGRLNLVEIPKDLSSNILIEEDFLLHEEALSSLKAMFSAAKKDGINHFKLNSAYRDSQVQQQLFDTYGKELALPAGFSEHESGLAIDIGSTEGPMAETDEATWLSNNAHLFGFILRYPAHKTEITGISFEPWHFRYVGLPHSSIMYENDLVLEEYIMLLEQGHTFEYSIKEKISTIFYTENLDQINQANLLASSGTNRNGYIVTSISSK